MAVQLCFTEGRQERTMRNDSISTNAADLIKIMCWASSLYGRVDILSRCFKRTTRQINTRTVENAIAEINAEWEADHEN